ncbi:MAG TPA: uroporphyrinogen-III C-methyltransferase [Parvibaculum sp.]|jgi:uroporphyrin-III C-methyltransferase
MPPLPRLEPGSVWLVGAGPGDPGLLTLHAYNALQQADVIVHDALIAQEVLDLAGPNAVFEFAGKRGGHRSCSQAEITQRLIHLAREGKRIVRLKGGDPFVFGRGGEEALALAEAGIPLRVVPGVTSGLAALTAAGIPATTRNTNAAITFATGHFADDGPGDTDWRSIAKAGHPLILYMAVQTLGSIADALIEGGLAPDMPVAVISNATTPRQHILDTRLDRAHDDAIAACIEAPAIVAIGENVRLREKLARHMDVSAFGATLEQA